MNSGIQAVQNELEVTGDLDASRPQTVLHLGLGRTLVVPTEFLLSGMAPQIAGMAEDRSGVSSAAAPRAMEHLQTSAIGGEIAAQETVIPLISEQMQVGKQTVTTGKVRLHRDVESFTDSVTLPLTRTSWEIDRTPVGQLVAEKPEPRREEDVMIFPLVEERLVATREYFLIEEVRVRQVATTTERTATVELKRDVLTVERDGSAAQSE